MVVVVVVVELGLGNSEESLLPWKRKVDSLKHCLWAFDTVAVVEKSNIRNFAVLVAEDIEGAAVAVAEVELASNLLFRIVLLVVVVGSVVVGSAAAKEEELIGGSGLIDNLDNPLLLLLLLEVVAEDIEEAAVIEFASNLLFRIV